MLNKNVLKQQKKSLDFFQLIAMDTKEAPVHIDTKEAKDIHYKKRPSSVP